MLLSPAMLNSLWADDALPVAEVNRDQPVDFQDDILPLLRRNCIACHNVSDAESDLVLETPESILKGGAEGPGVVPGNADESLVFQLAAHQRESFMPPEDNTVGASDFTSEELGLIKLWIDQGAKGSVASDPGAIAWQPLPPGFNPIYAVAVSPNGRSVAAGRANQIFIYSVPSQQELGRLTDPELIEAGLYQRPGVAHRDLVHSLAFSPSGQWLASGGYGTVKLWQRETGVSQGHLPAATGEIRVLHVSQDGRRVAVAAAGGRVQVYDAATNQLLCTLADLPAEVTSVAFTPDANGLIGGLLDQTIRLWEVVDGREIARIETPAPVIAVAVTSDGKQIISGESDHRIRLWTTPEPSTAAPEQPQAAGPLKELQGHSGDVVALVPLPNHPTQFLSASLDGTARHWDAAGGEIRSLNHGAPLRCLAVRADGQRIASGSETGTVKLWNAQDGQQIAELTGDSVEQNEIADMQLAIDLARLQVRNAQSDLDAATQRKQEEIDNADKAAVELIRTRLELKQKAQAASEAVAAKETAEKELAALQAELAEAEAAKENVTEETKAQAEQVLNELVQKVKTAEQEFAKLGPPAQKATDEKASVEGAVESAQRAVERSKEAVAQGVAEVRERQQQLAQREEEQKAAEDRLARAQQHAASQSAWARELESTKVAADHAARAAEDQLRTAQAAFEAAHGAVATARDAVLAMLTEQGEVDAATQNSLAQARQQLRSAASTLGGAKQIADATRDRLAQLEQDLADANAAVAAAEDEAGKTARAAVVEYLSDEQAEAAKLAAEADQQLQMATVQQNAAAEAFVRARVALEAAAVATRKAADEAQQLVKTANEAKTAADQAATAADARSKAAATTKEAADAALSAAQEKLTQAADEAAKAIAEVELQNATRRQEAAAKEAAEAAAALQTAEPAKAAAQQAVTDAMAESQRMQEAANQARADAQRIFQEAQNALALADGTAGGARARAATAAQAKAAADAALAALRPSVRSVVFSPDGAQLAVVDAQGQTRFYSSETGAPLHQQSASAGPAIAAVWVTGDRLLVAAEDRSLTLTASVPKWTLRRSIGSADSAGPLVGRVTALDFSPSGDLLATGGGEASRSGELKLWNVESGQLVREIREPHSDVVLGVAFSPDGRYLASCGADRFLRVFEVETGNLIKSFEGHTHHVLGVSWRADGRLLVTSGADNVIKVWDVATGEQVRTIEGFDKEITAVEFLGASDNFVISTGRQQVATRNTGGGGGPNFAGATDFVYAVETSRDGKLVVAAGQDSVVRVWDQQGNSITTFAPPAAETAVSGDSQPPANDQAAR